MFAGPASLAVKWVPRLLIVAAAVWGLVVVLLYFLQDRFIYFPWKLTAREAAAEATMSGLLPWPGNGEHRGYLAEPREATPRGTVLVLHGNAGHALHRLYYAQALVPLGWRVVLLEYPGYGARPGKPGEERLVADAVESVQEAARHWGLPVVLVGESLGAGVAAAVTARVPDVVAGVGLITPWDSLPDLARRHYRLIPVSLLRDRYDSVANLRAYPGPVAVVTAGGDDIIPAPHAERLYASLSGRKRLWVLPGVGHNDWPDSRGQGWWREVLDFVAPGA